MKKEKKKKLESLGWIIGSADMFLSLRRKIKRKPVLFRSLSPIKWC